MELQTKVAIEPQAFCLEQQSDHIMTVGSCFATEMAAKMKDAGFDVLHNPFGVLYNPLSIAECLERCLDDRPIDSGDLVEVDGLWHSWLHHGSFSRSSKEECLEVCNRAIHEAHEFLERATCLIVTFGTAYVFELVENGMVVGNCHKAVAARFARRRLTVDEIVSRWQPLLARLPQAVFTVSPIRHMADGAHGNQLSKSTLILAVDQLQTHYFPSYEIMMDELRDYRFYADNMTHPSPLAVDIIWERFAETYFTPATRNLCRLNAKQAKRDRHIPLH